MEADTSPDTESSDSEASTDSEPDESPDVSLPPERVAELLERGDVEVIDVRASSEWEAGHVPGVRHVELDRLSARAETIDKGRPVVFQCRGGSRSEMVAAAFRESGWDAYNMDGGLRAWAERGLPLEPEGGHIEESSGLPGG
jgi:rhodanese-related sulfurtransferase